VRGVLDVKRVREDFPILHQTLSHGRSLVYLDNAATTQKPRAVIDALVGYYERDNANIHRGVHELSQRATAAFEEARAKISWAPRTRARSSSPGEPPKPSISWPKALAARTSTRGTRC